MLKMIISVFSSPERLLNVMSRSDMEEAREEGERILIDEDGAASVNLCSNDVKADFSRHVQSLKSVKMLHLPAGREK
jgi:predicted ABC-class ATPase